MKQVLAFLFIFVIFSACKNGKDKTDEATKKIALEKLSHFYDSVKVSSKNLPKVGQSIIDTPSATISFPVFKNDTINQFIKRQVFNYFAEEEPATSYQDIATSFIKGYDDFVNSIKEPQHPWFLKITIKVLKKSPTYLSLQYVHSDYTGGAHGNTSISFLNYNPETNKSITLDSLIQKEKMGALIKVAENIFRNNEKLSATESLEGKYFFDKGKFTLAQSFHVSDKGLVFLYNPYEIKSFAEGYTELIVPFTVLKAIAKPNTILTTPL